MAEMDDRVLMDLMQTPLGRAVILVVEAQRQWGKER